MGQTGGEPTEGLSCHDPQPCRQTSLSTGRTLPALEAEDLQAEDYFPFLQIHVPACAGILSSVKRRATLTQAVAWMDLEDIVLSDERTKLYDSTYLTDQK